MFKKLIYVSMLISTSSSHLFAMENSDEITKQNSRAIVPYNPNAQVTFLSQTLGIFEKSASHALSTSLNQEMEVLEQSFPPFLTLYKKQGSHVRQESLSIHCKNAIPGLRQEVLEESPNIEIDSNTIPYIMGYPFTLQGVPQYLTKGEFIITQSGKTGSHPISFCLPMNTKYQEKAKFDLRNGKYTKLDIVFEATVYPGGKIVDGVWTPQGKGTRVGAYLWCPLEEIKVDTLYLDITAGYKL